MANRIAAPQNQRTVETVKRAEALSKELFEVLESIGSSKKISQDTRYALADAVDIDRAGLAKVLTRALDELDAVPASRVDTDKLELSHGTVLCFDLWADHKADGTKPRKAGRTSTDDFRLIERFMKSHRGIELDVHRVPFGGRGERFEITGTKAAREKFENDPRWPRLQKALDDIYWTDHSAGYSDDIATRKRKIKDVDAYVFGK